MECKFSEVNNVKQSGFWLHRIFLPLRNLQFWRSAERWWVYPSHLPLKRKRRLAPTTQIDSKYWSANMSLVNLPHNGQRYQSPTNSAHSIQYIREFVLACVIRRIGGGGGFMPCWCSRGWYGTQVPSGTGREYVESKCRIPNPYGSGKPQ